MNQSLSKNLTFVATWDAALALGLTLAHVLEIPGKRTLSGTAWLAVQHTFYGGFAWVGGISEASVLLAAGGLLGIVIHQRQRLTAPLSVALCFVGSLCAYGFGNRQINAKIAAWTPATLPPNWPMCRACGAKPTPSARPWP